MDHTNHHEEEKGSYFPLVLIIGLIFLSTLTLQVATYFSRGQIDFIQWMMQFMAGFFLVFSGIKLLDLKGFAEGYSMYDVIATRLYSYGYVYPFLELLLGLMYLTNTGGSGRDLFTVILMSISGVGVLQSIVQKRTITCACLGTLLRVPLTKITLVEDFGMVAMALLMFVQGGMK